MTDIVLRVADSLGSPARVELAISPTRRFIHSGQVILPDTVTLIVTMNPTIISLAPTANDWCWRISEKSNYLATKYFQVPDVLTSIEYVDLVEVDPNTLAPVAVPEAAWWAAINTQSYSTINRPSSAIDGSMIIDSTLGKPVWRIAGNWKDAMGTTV